MESKSVNPANTTTNMTSSRDKGKRPAPSGQDNLQNYKLRFLKPVIRPSMFKLSLLITSDELPNLIPYLDLVVPDGMNDRFRCFWTSTQNGKIALTGGWQEFYRRYQINLDSMLCFKHKGNYDFQVCIFDFGGIENSYQQRHPEEQPYEKKGNFQAAKCINNPSSERDKVVATRVSSKWLFFGMEPTGPMMSSRLLSNVPHLSHFTAQRYPVFLTHSYIEVAATYTRYSGKRNGSFGIISGG